MVDVAEQSRSSAVSAARLELGATAVLFLDVHGRVVRANGAAATRWSGHVVGRHLTEVLVGVRADLLTADLDQVRRHRCTLRRSVALGALGPPPGLVLTIGVHVVEGTVVRFVARVAETHDAPGPRGFRGLLDDLARHDPLRVVLLVDRLARCVAGFGSDLVGLGLDAATLVGENLAVGMPELLRTPVLSGYATALAGEPSEVEVTSPAGGRRFLVTGTPVRSAADFDGVVITCLLRHPGEASTDPTALGPRHVLHVGGVTVDLVTRQVEIAGRPGAVRLTGRECELLCDLMEHDGTPRTREDLLATVWGIPFATSTSVVDVTMHRLRLKLQIDALRTVRGSGLLFCSSTRAATGHLRSV